ncbi:MAG: SurA N-terminal domain-containing protein [Azonexus sp.]|nr:SurA N-terminal domain-containing protein [Betaproteobacteria bacterium]MBK8918030.1 SurA N-terminal domain-containing protein [Betaproteobacteria bacterium]MBP6036775.1 SurA N-terminal domain-containing protein [Azonexus sp.]MBP6907328.1 SurA N-terminal domain-containing protein [Azonexus sp.]
MFDAVRNNKRIVQIFLALITLPFALWGVDAYVRDVADDGVVARIGEVKITPQHFQQALREQEERIRNQTGSFDPKLFDNPEARKAVIDDMIDQQLILLEASKKRMMASDAAVSRAIANIPALQVDGKFSLERYEQAVKAQGLTMGGFEARVRQDLTLQQLAGSIGQTGILSRTVTDKVLAMQAEKREVQEFRYAVDDWVGKAKLEDDAARKYYDANPKQFEVAEQAQAEFVVLSLETVSAQVSVPEAEVKAWYEGHKSRYGTGEERRAAHILIGLENSDKAKAKSKADAVLKEVRAQPAAFADLAKKHSADPGSAAKGGDLGFFARGAMVKPFEEAAFSLKEGEISGVVESEFGYHIIKLTGIHGAKEKPYAEVKGEIEAELKRTAAARKFAEAAEAFTNMVYEQSDSLAAVAEKYKLEVRKTAWLTRQANPANGHFANEKLLAAVFSEDAVKNRRNTEAIEVAPNTLVAARVAEHKPAALRAFDEVKGAVETVLRRREAQAMAVKEGEARLAELRRGEDKLAWGAAKTLSRLDALRVPPQAVPAILKVDAAKLPGYAGVELPDLGYALFKVVKVLPGEKLDEARRQSMLRQYTTLVLQEEVKAYLAGLRSRYKVEINHAALEAKDK